MTIYINSIVAFKEAFALVDKKKKGHIRVKDLTSVMRSLGVNPTESEILDIMNEIDIDGMYNMLF